MLHIVVSILFALPLRLISIAVYNLQMRKHLTNSETQNQDCVIAKLILTMLQISAPKDSVSRWCWWWRINRCAGSPLDLRVEEPCQSIFMLNSSKYQTSKFLLVLAKSKNKNWVSPHRPYVYSSPIFMETFWKYFLSKTILKDCSINSII